MSDFVGALGRAARSAVLAAAAFGAIAVELAPMPPTAAFWPTPDLLLCVLAAAVLRAPSSAPALLVFALGLLRDLLGGGPVGAGALGLTLAMEALRAASERLRRRSFAVRWGALAVAAALGCAAPWLLAAVTLAPAPAPGDLAARVAATVAVYPLAALVMRAAMRRPALRNGEPARRGHLLLRRAP